MDTLDIVKRYGKDKKILELCCKIESAKSRYYSVKTALKLLSIEKNNIEMIELLMKWGYNVDLPISTKQITKLTKDNEQRKEENDMLFEKLKFVISSIN